MDGSRGHVLGAGKATGAPTICETVYGALQEAIRIATSYARKRSYDLLIGRARFGVTREESSFLVSPGGISARRPYRKSDSKRA